jgi:hypothetical protein
MIREQSVLPVIPMVWTLPDAVIEDAALRERQFHALVTAGFDGVAVHVRCSRYTWDDPEARVAVAHISRMCKAAGIKLWTGPDPRFISRSLIGEHGGAELLLFGNMSRATVFPHRSPIERGRFSHRCELAPRHGHMFHEVALEFLPLGLARVYAVRSGLTALAPDDIVDITSASRMFYNARDRYVEAFGSCALPDDGNWEVVAFFRVRSSHVDYSNRGQMREYARRLAQQKKAGIHPHGLMWDEPGYTCTYGSLPYTPSIRAAWTESLGLSPERILWKMALDAADGSHVPCRQSYYRIVQQTVVDAQRATNRVMRRLWGARCVAGIHDTWHFESGDMCDMNHGSMDLWKGAEAKSGGFVDIGGVNDLRLPSSPYYANLAALSVIASSLGRHSAGRFAYNNLWTVGDDNGEGWQMSVMDHCVDVMAFAGHRWLAHAYGPVGTVGQERSFLGSPPLPGYPDHSTWPGYPVWNRRLREHCRVIAGHLPVANVLVVFPVDVLHGLADTRADRVAAAVFANILSLVDAHYHPDVVSPILASHGRWVNGTFVMGRHRYDAVVLPYEAEPDRNMTIAMRKGGERVVRFDPMSVLPAALPERLASLGVPRPAYGPAGTWISMTAVGRETVVTIIPARHQGVVEGEMICGPSITGLPRTNGLVRVRFPEHAAPAVDVDAHRLT